MMRHRRANCCEYREDRRKLTLKRLQKKNTRTRGNISANGSTDNGCEDHEEKPEERECENEKPDKTSKTPKLVSMEDEILSRIKPSMDDREKYFAGRHVRCFLETADIEKLKLREKKIIAEACGSGRDSKPMKKYGGARDTRPLKSNNEDKKDEEPEEDDGGRKAENETSDPKNAGQKKQKKRTEKYSNVEPWCSKSKRKKKYAMEVRASSPTESDCVDSICSFDSQINLSGLALTKEENEKIEKMRRSKVHSSTGK